MANRMNRDPNRDHRRVMVFSTKLHKLRVTAGMTQEALAAEANVDVSTISYLENSRRFPSLEMAIRLAEALGKNLLRRVSLEELR